MRCKFTPLLLSVACFTMFVEVRADQRMRSAASCLPFLESGEAEVSVAVSLNSCVEEGWRTWPNWMTPFATILKLGASPSFHFIAPQVFSGGITPVPWAGDQGWGTGDGRGMRHRFASMIVPKDEETRDSESEEHERGAFGYCHQSSIISPVDLS